MKSHSPLVCNWCERELPRTRRYFPSPMGTPICWVCFYKHCAENDGPAVPEKYVSWEAFEAAHTKPVRRPAQKRGYDPEYARAYRKAHAERYATHARNRHARQRQNGGAHTEDDVQLQLKSQRGLCWWCGAKLGDKYHVDHRVPLDKNGTNDPGNLVIACPTCNLKKHDKMPYEFNGRLL